LFKPSSFLIFLFTIALSGCHSDYTPKPRGYFRIEFPEKKYQLFEPAGCPFSFEIPSYCSPEPDINRFAEPCWMNLKFNSLNGEINLSYKTVNNNLGKYIEDSHTLVYKHTVKADAIDEKRIAYPPHHVYGMMFELGGDAASSIQFYVTDSSAHFIRGALYFNVPPRSDSLAPVIAFVKQDIEHILHTIRWK
jgi:gliding motility-associated lipoprotein GldD